MTDVFLSYSRENQTIARRFADGLQAEGFSVWWDQALSAGQAFDRVTEKALAEARAIVVLWSKDSVDSNWVRAEATQARTDNRLVPVTIEPCKRPIMFELTHTADLVGWSGDKTDPRWRSFVDDLRKSAGVEAAAPATPPSTPRVNRRLAGWIAAGIALALAAGVAWFLYQRSVPTSTEKVNPSIAVLPFENLSSDPEQGYFADGLTEEILNVLAGIPKLKVTARTSSFAFKGKTEDLRAIGQTLGVAHVLEGSVRKSGDRVKITAQLIRTDSGFHLWSKTYDQPFADIFKIQEDIARQVAEALQVSLGVGLWSEPGSTRSAEAWEAFKEAQVHWGRNTPAGWRRAMAQDERAVDLDRSYANAWADLGYIYAYMPDMVGGDVAEWRRKSDAAFAEARRLQPESPYLHSMLFGVAWRDRRFDDALAHFKDQKAAMQKLGQRVPDSDFPPGLLYLLGRTHEYIAEAEQITGRDPLNFDPSPQLAMAYSQTGDSVAAFAEAERGFQLPGASPLQKFGMAIAGHIIAMGAKDRGQLVHWLTEMGNNDVDTARKEIFRQLIAGLNTPAESLAGLQAQLRDPTTPLQQKGNIASWLAYYGDTAGALEALRAERKVSGLDGIAPLWLAVFRDVRKLDGFKQLVREAGFVEMWKKTGWGDYCKPVGTDDFECQ